MKMKFRFSYVAVVILAVGITHPASLFAAGSAQPQWVSLRQEADAKGKAGDYQDALQLLQQAVKAAPEPEVGLYVRIADAAAQLGRRKEGLKAIDEALNLRPDLKDNAKVKQIQQQLESLQAAKQVPQTNAPAVDQKTALAVATARLTVAEAQQALKEGDNAKAQKLAKQARDELLPAVEEPDQKDVQAWRLLGAIALVTTNSSDAAFAFEAIKRLKPDYTQDEHLLNLMALLNRMPGLQVELLFATPLSRQFFQESLTRATNGDVKAMCQAADDYESHNGVVQDYSQTSYWYQKAYESGSAEAADYLGAMYFRLGNWSQAAQWYITYVRHGTNTFGLCNAADALGDMYYTGEGEPQDYKQAIKWFREAITQAAESSNPAVSSVSRQDLCNIGTMYHLGEAVAKNDRQAVKFWEQAAAKGSEAAIFNLGACYMHGWGLRKSYQQALNWFRKAAANGNAQAMFNIGTFYDFGEGVRKDPEEAVNWYRKAAANGNPTAMLNLGDDYDDGNGVEQDTQQAMDWYRKAANNGLPIAMFNIGIMYAHGEGVVQDFTKAADWFRKAAAKGNASAMFALGLSYSLGHGVPKNQEEGNSWCERAARKGNKTAQRFLRQEHLSW